MLTMPWKLAKENEKEKLEELFAILVEGIRWMSSYLNIFLPDISSLINKQFYFKNDELPTEFVLDRKITTEHAPFVQREKSLPDIMIWRQRTVSFSVNGIMSRIN